MPSFKFECEHRTAWDQELDSRLTMEFDKETLTEVIDQFQDFLRGCGYYFEGRLEIVNDEEDTTAFFDNAKHGARAFDNMASSLTNDKTETIKIYGTEPFSFSINKTTCPVCKLDAELMSRHKCFDPKCGLK